MGSLALPGGILTIPVLRGLGIPHYSLEEPAQVEKLIRAAQCLAESSLSPVALLLTRELMWEEA